MASLRLRKLRQRKAPIKLSDLTEVVPICPVSSTSSNIDEKLSAPDKPFERSGHRIVADNNFLYSIGGFNPELWDQSQSQEEDTYYPLFKELWRFNLITKRWKKLETSGSMPLELASHSACLHQGFIIVFGGTGVPFGHSSSNDIHFCRLSSLQWFKFVCDSALRPQKQYGHAMTMNGSELYVVGGTTGFTYNMEVFRIDFSKAEPCWENLSASPQPSPRYRHEIAYYEGKLFLFGGGTSDEVFGFDQIDVFDIARRTWHKINAKRDSTEKVPRARRCHALVKYQGFVYMLGGFDGSHIFSDIWRFDLQQHVWKKLPTKLKEACFFHDACVTPNGCLYVFGGVIDVGNTVRSSKVFKMWLNAPSLEQLCLEQLTAQNPDLLDKSASELKIIGVPSLLIEYLTK